jgi:hypothetical protein
MSHPSFQSYEFISSLVKAFARKIAARDIQNPSQYVGAQSSSTFVHENLLLCEGYPLWNRPEHGDTLYSIREMCACALELTLEDFEDDLSNAVVVDLVVDSLALAVRRSFSILQTQQLLLLVTRTHSDVVGIRYEGSHGGEGEGLPCDEDELEGVVARRLTKRMIELTGKVPTPCVEQRTIMETSFEERVDPVALAALEAKRDPKANKKQQTVFDDLMRNLPRVRVEVQIPKQIEVEVLVDVGPIFSYEDAACICNHISETLLVHWRLYRYCRTQQREEQPHKVEVEIRDAPPFSIPALATALPESDFHALQARRQEWNNAHTAISSSFLQLFVDPLAKLRQSADVLLSTFLERCNRDEGVDRDAALPLEEFEKTVDVLRRRIAKKVVLNTTVSTDFKGPAATQNFSQRAAQQPITPPRATSSASNASDTCAASRVGDIPETFDFAIVEQRLLALTDAVNKATSAASPPPAKGRR